MFNKNNRLESKSSKQRYLVGKDYENSIINCLRTHGLQIEAADNKTDTEDKIDCYLIEESRKKPCQVKTRMSYSGKQFLIDVFEPFYGIDSDATKYGRDYLGQYEVYIVLIDKNIYVVDGKSQKEIIQKVLEEWKSYRYQLPVFDSHLYNGVQIRYTIDKSNGRPKILMFIDSSVYNENNIRIFNYNKE